MLHGLPNGQTDVKGKFAYLALSQYGLLGKDCRMGKPNRIREWRDARGLTLEDLADLSGISVSYLSRMERGGRNVSIKSLEKISTALHVHVRDLVRPAGDTVPLVGYVGAGAETIMFGDGQGPFDEVPAPEGANETTVAAEIRGTSLGSIFDRWLVYYDQVDDPPTSDLANSLCVCGLEDGRVLIKLLKQGNIEARWTLHSTNEEPIYDVPVRWAARVKQMSPR